MTEREEKDVQDGMDYLQDLLKDVTELYAKQVEASQQVVVTFETLSLKMAVLERTTRRVIEAMTKLATDT